MTNEAIKNMEVFAYGVKRGSFPQGMNAEVEACDFSENDPTCLATIA